MKTVKANKDNDLKFMGGTSDVPDEEIDLNRDQYGNVIHETTKTSSGNIEYFTE